MQRSTLWTAALTLVAATTASAQGGPVPPPAAAPAAGKVAVIDTRAFGEGITELKNAGAALDMKFKPQIDALQALVARRDSAMKLATDPKGTDASRRTALERAQDLEKEIKRKQEDAQASYQREQATALAPLREKIAKFLVSYAQSKGIGVLIDAGALDAVGAGGAIVFVAEANDVTDDVMKEYNKANPATTAAAPARR